MSSKSVLVYCNDVYETPELIASVSRDSPQSENGGAFELAQAQALYDELLSRELIRPYTREFRLQYLENGIPTCYQRWDVAQGTATCKDVLSAPLLRDQRELPNLSF